MTEPATVLVVAQRHRSARWGGWLADDYRVRRADAEPAVGAALESGVDVVLLDRRPDGGQLTPVGPFDSDVAAVFVPGQTSSARRPSGEVISRSTAREERQTVEALVAVGTYRARFRDWFQCVTGRESEDCEEARLKAADDHLDVVFSKTSPETALRACVE